MVNRRYDVSTITVPCASGIGRRIVTVEKRRLAGTDRLTRAVKDRAKRSEANAPCRSLGEDVGTQLVDAPLKFPADFQPSAVRNE